MHGMREWLDALGLDRYSAVFEANDIDLHLSLIHISEPTRPY